MKNLALHRKAIFADINLAKTEWKDEQYFKTGVTVADLLNLAIGPIKPIYPPTTDNGLDPLAVPDFVAGLIYGFTGDNELTEIEACF